MSDGPTVDVRVTVNGHEQVVTVHPMARLVDVLRVDLHRTGPKEGCGEEERGACSVLLNGGRVNSCLPPGLHVDGASMTPIERLAPSGDRLLRVQQGFLEH